jgi:hypothetical protein
MRIWELTAEERVAKIDALIPWALALDPETATARELAKGCLVLSESTRPPGTSACPADWWSVISSEHGPKWRELRWALMSRFQSSMTVPERRALRSSVEAELVDAA